MRVAKNSMGRLCIVIMMLVAAPSWASALSDAEILGNIAQLRTLAVSAGKHHVNAASIDVSDSRDALNTVVAGYDKALRTLRSASPNSRTRHDLKQLDEAWKSYQDTLSQSLGRDQLEILVEATNKLVFLADNLATNWSGIRVDRDLDALNLAHQQAMLSERIGLLYGAHYLGLRDGWVVEELNATLHAYERGLNFLTRFLRNEDTATVHLAQISSQWALAKEGFAKFNQGYYLPKLIAVTMNSMEDEMVSMAGRYAISQNTADALVQLSIPGLAANVDMNIE